MLQITSLNDLDLSMSFNFKLWSKTEFKCLVAGAKVWSTESHLPLSLYIMMFRTKPQAKSNTFRSVHLTSEFKLGTYFFLDEVIFTEAFTSPDFKWHSCNLMRVALWATVSVFNPCAESVSFCLSLIPQALKSSTRPINTLNALRCTSYHLTQHTHSYLYGNFA